MARPSKRSNAALAAVCDALASGATYVQAAGSAGISHDTLTRWRRDDDDARRELERAEQVAARRWLACIDRAADTEWRAAAWLLERRFPEIYRRGEYRPEPESTCREFVVRIDGDD